jgi:hypothetical protein
MDRHHEARQEARHGHWKETSPHFPRVISETGIHGFTSNVQILSLLRSPKQNPKGYFLVEAEICDAELGELQCVGINYFSFDIFGRNSFR